MQTPPEPLGSYPSNCPGDDRPDLDSRKCGLEIHLSHILVPFTEVLCLQDPEQESSTEPLQT